MKHLRSLDCLRGLACLLVFFCHGVGGSDAYKHDWKFIFTAGNEAVVLFFVLSGFVLTLAYNKSNKFNYLLYFKKRVFRIYPAYYLSIVIILFFAIIKSKFDYSLTYILRNILLFTQTDNFDTLNSPSWSLAYELIISTTILPLFWYFKRHKLIWWVLTSGILFCVYVDYFIHIPAVTKKFPIENPLIGIPYYSISFLIGVLVCEYKDHLVKYVTTALIPIYIVLFFNFFLSYQYGSLTLVSIGSAGIVVAAVKNGRVNRLLENKILLFYGKISYSFYILHAVVLEIVKDYLPANLHPKIVFVFILSTIISYFSFKYIEQSGLKLINK